MNTNDTGIFVASVSPLAPLPVDQGEISFRDTMRIVAFKQDMDFDIEILAHSFDEAAQRAYAKISFTMAAFAQIAKQASDALLSKLGKAT
jgi:hypothetical protein